MNKYAVLNPSIAKHQSGVVLVISLIMLLALTLIGVTSSSVTGLEEKMAANTKDKNLAFQAAESALRWVETSLGTTNVNFANCTAVPQIGTNGLYYSRRTSTQDPPYYPYYTWYSSPTQYVTPNATAAAITTTATLSTPPVNSWFTDATDAATCGNATTTTPNAAIYTGLNISGVCRNPRYIIEKLDYVTNTSTGSTSLEGGTASSGQTTGETDTFRITVQGWGSNANSAAQVQSVVKVSYNQMSTSNPPTCP